MPILRDPAPPPSCDVLIIESTYGDRLLKKSVTRSRGKLNSSSRSQRRITAKIIVPDLPLGGRGTCHADQTTGGPKGQNRSSPFISTRRWPQKSQTCSAKHPECYDEETYRTFTSEETRLRLGTSGYVSSPDESKRLNTLKGPCVIIASSGMCEGTCRAPSETCDPGPKQHDRHRGFSG